ncbi:MAG: nucleotidyltransferase family protein [Cyanobacteria bacterium J06621_11]
MIDEATTRLIVQDDASKPLSRQFVVTRLQESLDAIRSFKVKSLELFGSVARDEATPNSDLDFLVEFEGTATLRGYMGLKFFLEELFGCSVDLVSRKKLKPLIRETVLKEAIRVA